MISNTIISVLSRYGKNPIIVKEKIWTNGSLFIRIKKERQRFYEEVGEGGDVRVYPSNMRGPRHIGNVWGEVHVYWGSSSTRGAKIWLHKVCCEGKGQSKMRGEHEPMILNMQGAMALKMGCWPFWEQATSVGFDHLIHSNAQLHSFIDYPSSLYYHNFGFL